MTIKKSFIVIFILIFAAGLIAGYGIWGRNGVEKIGVKQLLHKAIQEIDVIEKENQELKVELEQLKELSKETHPSVDLKPRVSILEKENQTLKDQIEKVRQNKKKLENRRTQLETDLSKAKEEAKAEEELKTRLLQLEAENKELKSVIEKINTITKSEEKKVITEVTPETTPEVIPEETKEKSTHGSKSTN